MNILLYKSFSLYHSPSEINKWNFYKTFVKVQHFFDILCSLNLVLVPCDYAVKANVLIKLIIVFNENV